MVRTVETLILWAVAGISIAILGGCSRAAEADVDEPTQIVAPPQAVAPPAPPQAVAPPASDDEGPASAPDRDYVAECGSGPSDGAGGCPIEDRPADVVTSNGNVRTWRHLHGTLGSPNGRPAGDPAAAAAAMQWVRIPLGTYSLGRRSPSFPAGHSLAPYEAEVVGRLDVAATETTNHQYRLFYGTDWPGDDPWPAKRVNFYQARAFCAAVGGRLPTEADWEIAARAGTQTPWSFDEEANEHHRYGWYDQPPARSPFPVARLEPNPWGIYDMHGNVWEWTEGCFDPDRPGPDTAQGATEAELKQHEGAECHRRTLRGGSFLDEALAQRSAHRSPYPAVMRCGTIGFRCVRGDPARVVE